MNSVDMKPVYEKRVDLIGIALKLVFPIGFLVAFIFSLFPMVIEPKYNFVHSFIVHVFGFDSEKTCFWHFFRIFEFVIILLDTSYSIAACTIHAIVGILYTRLLVTWETYLLRMRTDFSWRSFWLIISRYSILRVFNATGQSAVRIITPIFLGSSFTVTVICTVSLLSVFHRMNLIILIFLAWNCTLFLVVTMSLLNIASLIAQRSTEHIDKLKLLPWNFRRKQIQTVLKSLQPMGLAVGGFYLVTKQMVLIYGFHFLDKTVTALIVTK